MRIAVLQGNDWNDWSQRHEQGLTNSRWPYGADRLQWHGWDVVHPQGEWRPGPKGQFLRRVVGQVERATDAKIAHPLSAVTDRQVRRADAAFAVFEDMAWPWAVADRRLPPLYIVSCWLGQRLLLKDMRAAGRWAHLARRAVGLSVFSENQVPLITQRLGVPEDKIAVVRFGTDTSYFTPGEQRSGEYVLAVGGDVGRDWPTFFRAAALTPEVKYRLLTVPARLKGLEVPENVTVDTVYGPGYRDVVRNAALVAIPTHPLAYPTGQSVLLNAMAMGTPVVVSESPAMRDYVDERANVTVRPGDPEQLARTIRELLADPQRREEMSAAARQIAVERYDTAQMWDSLAEHLVKALS